jgi:hypothetical protein
MNNLGTEGKHDAVEAIDDTLTFARLMWAYRTELRPVDGCDDNDLREINVQARLNVVVKFRTMMFDPDKPRTYQEGLAAFGSLVLSSALAFNTDMFLELLAVELKKPQRPPTQDSAFQTIGRHGRG